jgi:hypothetical protein
MDKLLDLPVYHIASIICMSPNSSTTKYKITYLAPNVIVERVARTLLVQEVLVFLFGPDILKSVFICSQSFRTNSDVTKQISTQLLPSTRSMINYY